jgi:hypothetical protein
LPQSTSKLRNDPSSPSRDAVDLAHVFSRVILPTKRQSGQQIKSQELVDIRQRYSRPQGKGLPLRPFHRLNTAELINVSLIFLASPSVLSSDPLKYPQILLQNIETRFSEACWVQRREDLEQVKNIL